MLDDAVRACHKHISAEANATLETVHMINSSHDSVSTAEPDASSECSTVKCSLCHVLHAILYHIGMLTRSQPNSLCQLKDTCQPQLANSQS